MGGIGSGGARRNKPAALRAVSGSRVRPHHRERPEPTFRVVTLGTPPDTLDAVGAAYWAHYGDVLERSRVLTEGDRDALFDFCFAAQRMAELRAAARDGEHVKGWDMQYRQWQQIARLLRADLGLSPAARPRITGVPTAAGEDPFDAFLSGGKVVGGRG
jgi:phage terminase small subunit